MKLRFGALLMCMVILAVSVCGCAGNPENPADKTEPTAEVTAEPTPEPTPEPKPLINPENDTEKLVFPFWRMNTMYNESTTFIVRDDGTITAKLLFKPIKIISVLSNDLKTEYAEGTDYVWDGASNTLTLPEGSKIKYFTKNDIEGKDENGKQLPLFDNNNWDKLGRSRFGNALFCVSAFLYEKQIAVTYEYEPYSWNGPVTEYQGDLLPNTLNKLKNKEELRLFYYGDSIFTGCDSSKMHGRKPNQDSFPGLTKKYLGDLFDCKIKLQNPSVGGMDSKWGVDNAVKLVGKKTPDLVAISFGMNDQISGAETAANFKKIMDSIKELNPDCEFILVACMCPNKNAGFLVHQNDVPAELMKLKGEGVAVVDIFDFHSYLLETKDFISMSGNDINHPNDWLIRIYAMNILSALVDF